jgi:BirA family biotin operon repressor/biotin-[acetyl-CoA-carboxylase] ligase
LGRRVRVHVTSGVYEGVAEDVDEDGALILRLPDGGRLRVVAGEVG